MDEIWANYDTNGNGYLCRNEFNAFAKATVGPGCYDEAALEDMFMHLDVDQD